MTHRHCETTWADHDVSLLCRSNPSCAHRYRAVASGATTPGRRRSTRPTHIPSNYSQFARTGGLPLMPRCSALAV